MLNRLFSVVASMAGLITRAKLSYLPPLMVYLAAGVSSITAIVGTFYVKERLGLSAEFLAALGFWAALPWAFKMPLGHLVDLIWRWKSILIFIGAGFIALSIAIMVGLLADPDGMRAIASIETWFVLSVLLAPVGYVLQDVVADAMTVEAIPLVDHTGRELTDDERKPMHTDLQTLGRVAIVGGGMLVAAINMVLMEGVNALSGEEKAAAYLLVYKLALVVPLISISGIVLSIWVKRRSITQLVALGKTKGEAANALYGEIERPRVNWWILGGGLAFVFFSLTLGLNRIPFGQEIMFAGTAAIVIFIVHRLLRELDRDAQRSILGIAVVIFCYRAMPGVGDGASWWSIDVLGFDQQFMSVLEFISGGLTLFGMFAFRRFMAERSIPYIVGFLTIIGTILYLPNIGMFYGLHEWTAAHTGGVVDARFIALTNTTLSSPLGQIAMIPMLAWIANSAPANLKATYFAVLASFTNLALSTSNLSTKYLNKIFVVTREVKDAATGAITTPANYGELGAIMITSTVIGLVIPLIAILWHRHYANGRTSGNTVVEHAK